MTGITVAAAVIQRDDRLLLCQRPPHKPHGGLWEFPGGKTKPGESTRVALARELEEELGINAAPAQTLLTSLRSRNPPICISFFSVQTDATPQLLEHSALGWFRPGECQELALAPLDRRFLTWYMRPNQAPWRD